MAIWTPKIAGFNILPIKIPTLVSPETLSSNLDNGLNFTRTDWKLKRGQELAWKLYPSQPLCKCISKNTLEILLQKPKERYKEGA